MKKVLFILLFLIPAFAQGQYDFANVSVNEKNFLGDLDSNWRFINEDDKAMSDPGYNDSTWMLVNSRLSGDSLRLLNGIGWFRKQVYVPDSIINEAMVLKMKHYGASQIFIDGKLVAKFGNIAKSEKHTSYKNPGLYPYFFHFDDTGTHTIAVRFANYRKNGQPDNESYMHGFSLSVLEANNTFLFNTVIRVIIFGMFLFLFGAFFALAAVHLLLWLFRYKDKSNLFLSILCIVFCSYFFMLGYWSQVSDGDKFIQERSITAVLMAVVLITLSALLNDLFGRLRLRFLAIVTLCITAMVLTLKQARYEGLISHLVTITVMAEAIVLIIHAIRNKIKGARILAAGVLPLAISTFIIIVLRIFFSDDLTNIDTTNPKGFTVIFVGFFSAIQVLTLCAVPLSMSAFLAWRFATVNKDLSKQLDNVKSLSEQTQKQELEKKRILENQKAELEREVAERTSEIIEEKKKSDELLHNILPEEVAEELKDRGATTAHRFDQVTVIFTDFVNFTLAGERMGSEALVEELHNCFKAFDQIMGKYHIEKIKTIGDAYLAVCGLPTADQDHAEKVVQAAKEILAFMQERRQRLGDKTFEIRIGIHSGEVVAGIVGVKKFAYDIWGDTVNTAARMESKSLPGKINISQTTYDLVQSKFTCTYRGELEAKNKGKLKMYFVEV